MTKSILRTNVRTCGPALWLMTLAIVFAASPVIARAQETQGAALPATAQTVQRQQVSGQETDKTGSEKGKTVQDQDKDKKDEKKDEKTDEKKDDPDNPKNDRLFLVVANYA